MNVFLVYVRDENFYQLLPEECGGSKPGDERVKVMAFPPIGIETLASVVRQYGHRVRMFDTCHPQMKAENIAQAVEEERPANHEEQEGGAPEPVEKGEVDQVASSVKGRVILTRPGSQAGRIPAGRSVSGCDRA